LRPGPKKRERPSKKKEEEREDPQSHREGEQQREEDTGIKTAERMRDLTLERRGKRGKKKGVRSHVSSDVLRRKASPFVENYELKKEVHLKWGESGAADEEGFASRLAT